MDDSLLPAGRYVVDYQVGTTELIDVGSGLNCEIRAWPAFGVSIEPGRPSVLDQPWSTVHCRAVLWTGCAVSPYLISHSPGLRAWSFDVRMYMCMSVSVNPSECEYVRSVSM